MQPAESAPAPAAAAVRKARARLHAAGEALRARPAAERLAVLAALFERFRDAASSERAELAGALPEATGFHPETVRAGLAHGLAAWSGDALRQLVADELGDALGRGAHRARGFDETALVLAGAIPMPTLLQIAAPLLLGSPVLIKPSAHDPVTAPVVVRALRALDAPLGACAEVVPFSSRDHAASVALAEAACVVASGSDETLAEIASHVAPPRRFVGYGHRLSVAALGPGALQGDALREAAEGLALDVALWDQLGCLSPVAVYVEVGSAARVPAPVLDAVAEALARAEARWPRGRIDAASAAAVSAQRAEAELRAAAETGTALRAGEGLAWTVVTEADARPRPAPLHRFLRLHPVEDASALVAALRPLGPRLAGVALAGFAARAAGELAEGLGRLGASRLCRPGALQAPPLAWHHDGQGVLAPLARWLDVEMAPSPCTRPRNPPR